MKILNLYACLGGNRADWGDEHEITAVELDPELARMYKERFPNDTVIIGDAHKYLLDHFSEFDFVWSSPPCPTHSRARFWRSSSPNTSNKAVYPDMMLYQEIILLDHYFKGRYCVENVQGYYDPLIPPKKRGRHYFWTNFPIPSMKHLENVHVCQGKGEIERLEKFHGVDISQYKGTQRKDKILRNIVDREAGKTILDYAMNRPRKTKSNQTSILDTISL